MSNDLEPQADPVSAGTSHELSDELSPSEAEKISGGDDFLNLGGIQGESQDHSHKN
jgi:hypothetical protein